MSEGRVTDATRLEAAVPTITELADKGAVVLILAHFGRPKGERRPDMSLSLITRPLTDVLGRPVMFISDSHGPDAERAVAMLAPGDIAILENTRFEQGEEKNDPALDDAGARMGHPHVNAAFYATHHAHQTAPRL